MVKLRSSSNVPLKKINITDNFWSQYQQLVRDVVIPYQWDALNDNIPDAAPSYAVRNFKIAAGEEKGEFGGLVFQDSDIAKWLEAVGYSLAITPNSALEENADKIIDLIEKAQRPDGYVNTYFTLKEPSERWKNLMDCHELYCAGHMIEAAVAYYYGTGKRKLLDIMCKYADYIDDLFGLEEGKINGYCGHQEIELALVKLYKATDNEKYLRLAKYFIDERGKQPYYFISEWEKRGQISHWTKAKTAKPNMEYHQAHLPVREQSVAVGHSVRAVYMYTAMADIAAETGDVELLEACRRLWDNMTNKQMYITGGIGSTAHGEAFTFDYDLPNDTIYAETCASIGLIFFAHRMLQIEAKNTYADVLERALYNTVVSGMAKDGKHFFYVNPLEVWPEASEKNPTRHHVKPVRQKWFGCACCPPNVARLLSSLGQYIYTSNSETIYTHLYIGGDAELEIGENTVKLHQETNYPWDGLVKINISPEQEKQFTLGFRVPGWCKKYEVRVNGTTVDVEGKVSDGYLLLTRVWKQGEIIELNFAMEAELIQANPKVRVNAGKVAIQRGPLVYCLEEIDNGDTLQTIELDSQSCLIEEYENILGGAVVIRAKGKKSDDNAWTNELYRPIAEKSTDVDIKAIPYFLWGNRQPGEMSVWIRYK